MSVEISTALFCLYFTEELYSATISCVRQGRGSGSKKEHDAFAGETSVSSAVKRFIRNKRERE